MCSLITQFCHSCTGSLSHSKACQLNSQTTVRWAPKLTGKLNPQILQTSECSKVSFCKSLTANHWISMPRKVIMYASLNSNHKIHSINNLNIYSLPGFTNWIMRSQRLMSLREKEIMRWTQEERQREKAGGVFQSDWPSLVSLRAAWCTPSHSPWLFLPKCCFDQDNITGKEMGMQTRRGGLILEHNWRVVTF